MVTGRAGFIGAHLVDSLTTRGGSVLVLDDFSTGSRANSSTPQLHLVDVVEGSVLDR